ncbi:hypothetical protein MTR67_022793 [Solanum verrucosum]|uniref:Endonuclease/exonuclease/phosphatase domain-containing protein n=1 Tax=Solanum verrucosum TaxID=315347 RepID=A0AAF0TY63_SOLVR|nr:hypothetical protein MTR67_022793 [Solanum verrucosum]
MKAFCRENNVILFAVLENKVKEERAPKIIKKLGDRWRWAANYNADRRGRIWLLWDYSIIDFRVDVVHQQFVFGYCTRIKSNTEFYFGAVYGLHTIADRRALWGDLEPVINNAAAPLVLMGDYNAIRKGDDRFNGNQVTDSETRDFNNFLLDNSLTEMKTVGRQYTWINNHTHSKIDRIIVNAEWVQQWPHIKGVILEPHFSDHCPLSVKMEEHDGKGPKPFRFYNYMAEHKFFITEVEESWNRRSAAKTMYEVWLKLKQMKVVMKNMAKKEFGNIEEKIIAARVALRNYQNTHSDPTRGQNQCHVENN